LTCSNAWIRKLGNNDLREATDICNKSKTCLPSCEYQTVTTSISSVAYPYAHNFHETKHFCLVLFKLALICFSPVRAHFFEKGFDKYEITCKDILNAHQVNKLCTEDQQPILKAVKNDPRVKNFIFKYAAENFAVLRVLIRKPYYTLIMQDEEFSYISYIGNVGGLLGLSMGLSFISIFEIVYCLVNILFRKMIHYCCST
jgi:hypothetical protein